ncbi:MAG: hypothetical protein IRY94_15365, partial [Rhodospirillaceae bacterium]|nr:hypothetical protein [Rhodospirillaceae bacterium]
MRRGIVAAAAAALAAGLLAPAAARAGSPQGEAGDPSRLAVEGLEKLMQALDLFIATLPQYEAPVITEDGDIVIRRKRTPAPPEAEPEEPGPPRPPGPRDIPAPRGARP